MPENSIITEFRQHLDQHIERHNCYGVDGHGDTRPFVPRVALTSFWTRERITSVRCFDELIPENTEDILDHYVVVFSILVLSRGPDKIGLFFQEGISDKRLPLREVPEAHHESANSEVFSEFMKFQWKFCPQLFDLSLRPKPSKLNMSPNVILPIAQKEKISPEANEDKDTAVLYKVLLHPQCSQTSEPVVFKQYCHDDAESQKLYENEWIMYSQLRDTSFNHIVKYYGSFECLGRRTIVLEYAPGGTLLSFFKEREPPRKDWQRQQFWQNIFGLLEGLEAIDDCTPHHRHSAQTWHLRGTHQDIRPQNILVFGNPSDNNYSVPFKLVDMGTAHLRKMKTEGIDRQAIDQYGNGMYSAPEAVRDRRGITNITNKSDVWSLGGIISEALVWSIWGEKGRQKYQTERIDSTRRTRLRGGYHEGAFHDGDSLLGVVEEWHARAVSVTGGSAGPLSDVVLGSMLVANLERRGKATSVLKDSKKVFKSLKTIDYTAQNFITGESPGWPSSPLPHTRTLGLDETEPSPTQDSWIRSTHQNMGYSSKTHITNTPTVLTSPGSEGFISERDEQRTAANRDTYHVPEYPLEESTDNNGTEDPKGKAPLRGFSTRRTDERWSSDLPERTLNRGFSLAQPQLHGDGQPGTSQQQSRVNHLESNIAASGRRTEAFNSAFPQDSPEASSSASQPEPGSGDPRRPQRVPSRREYGSGNRPGTRGSYEDGGEPSRPSKKKRTPTEPLITINDVWTSCLNGRSGGLGRVFKRTLDIGDPVFKAFPTLRPVLSRLRGDGGRNQIFVIDDSISMKPHQYQLGKTVRVLSRLLKVGQVDADEEFELYFASSHERVKERNSTALQVAVENHEFTGRRCEMHTVLDEIATRVMNDVQPVSIYVLTNGHWGNVTEPGNMCGVDRPIERLARHISFGRKQENWAIVQFIRFYRDLSSPADQCGEKRMKWLDDELQAARKLEVDIVDTRRADGDVKQILLGAFSKEADESSSSSE